MSSGPRLSLEEAEAISMVIFDLLEPHCLQEKLIVAGSVRRRRPTVGDIEIVCCPKAYEPEPLFRSGIALVVEQWPKVRGSLGPNCRYTKRTLPEGIGLDLFMPPPDSFGLITAIRTGSTDWNQHVLLKAIKRSGFESKDGVLLSVKGQAVRVPDEEALFRMIGLGWVDPWDREVELVPF